MNFFSPNLLRLETYLGVELRLNGFEIFYVGHNGTHEVWDEHFLRAFGGHAGVQIKICPFKRFSFGIGSDFTGLLHNHANKYLTFTAFVRREIGKKTLD